MPYCKNCGRLLQLNARFCGICGADQNAFSQPPAQTAQQSYYPPPPPPPEYSPPPQQYSPPQPYQAPAQPVFQPQVPPPQMSTQRGPESVLAAIPLRKPKSLGRYDSWNAVATNNRLVFAQVTSQMATNAATQARDQAKAEGKGFWGQWSDQLKTAFTYSQRYLSMDPNATLAETPGNFAVENAGISEIKLHLKDHNKGQGISTHEFSVEFKTAQGTFEFRMDEDSRAVDAFKKVYGDRVKMPLGYFSVGKGANIRIGL